MRGDQNYICNYIEICDMLAHEHLEGNKKVNAGAERGSKPKRV